jgi:integrase
MANRRDTKNRILRPGEGQRSDGRYYYRYTDAKGARRCVYSWTLTAKDITPRGRKPGECLRDLEERVLKDLFAHVAPDRITVLELARKYTDTKTSARETTKTGYKTVLNFLETEPFGARKICDVTTLDAKEWLIRLQRDLGKSYSTIHSIRGVLRPAFQLAEEDDLIRRNPFDFELSTVLTNDMVRRNALSTRDERRFLEFARGDKTYRKYYEGFYILLNTGLRISEFCGLTIGDIDFDDALIRVDKQLQRSSGGRYYIERPKTGCGERFVPMTAKVAECFRAIIDRRKTPPTEPVVDGVSGFVFLDKNGNPEVALHWENHFRWCIKKHNGIYKDELPKVTPHVCRHTFCSKMARNGMNPAKLKYIMGHADIDVTYNVYTHMRVEDVREDMMLAAESAA